MQIISIIKNARLNLKRIFFLAVYENAIAAINGIIPKKVETNKYPNKSPKSLEPP